MDSERTTIYYCRLILAITTILHINALSGLIVRPYRNGILLSSQKWVIVIAFNLALIALELVFLAASWFAGKNKIPSACNAIAKFISRMNSFILGVAVILILSGTSYIIFSPYHYYFDFRYIRTFWLWLSAVLLSFFVHAWQIKKKPNNSTSWWLTGGSSLLFVTAVFKAFSYLPSISTYPFSLYWSEGSHYYYASLFFSKKIYGFQVPLPVLHPTQYFMQSFPFLFNIKAIWIHRAWEVFLWIATPLITAFLLTRRLSITSRLRKISLIAWIFLFLLIGPVFYHLLLMVILILWGFKTSKTKPQWEYFLRNTILIVFASLWAGVSRVNWFPLPASLAAVLYLLEVPYLNIAADNSNSIKQQSTGKFSWLPYFYQPAIWLILGIAAALASQALYILLSGNPP